MSATGWRTDIGRQPARATQCSVDGGRAGGRLRRTDAVPWRPMRLAVTGPLRREVARALPSRPFARALLGRHRAAGDRAATAARPTFTVRSPRAVAHALRAPGQLGLGRAYVSGELAVDDIDAVMRLLDDLAAAAARRARRGRG